MSQRYDQPPTPSVRGSRDIGFPSTSAVAPCCGVAAEDSRAAASVLVAEGSGESRTARGVRSEIGHGLGGPQGRVVIDCGSVSAAVETPVGRDDSPGKRDFYSGLRRPGRWGWMASLRLDAYAWRAIFLMLSFLAFGLIVSSFVLSL